MQRGVSIPRNGSKQCNALKPAYLIEYNIPMTGFHTVISKFGPIPIISHRTNHEHIKVFFTYPNVTNAFTFNNLRLWKQNITIDTEIQITKRDNNVATRSH